MQPGEVVIDLGSGAGFDCFLAAGQVGPAGKVIGVDMTHEMLKKARENAAKIGAQNGPTIHVERLSPAATVRESAGLDNDQAQLRETAAAAPVSIAFSLRARSAPRARSSASI